jgi:hypothetical protein
MHTLVELVERAVPLPGKLSESTGLPATLKARAKLIVPGERAMRLPIDVNGMRPLGGLPTTWTSSTSEHLMARAALLSQPGVVFPLPSPLTSELQRLGIEPGRFRNENPRQLGLAITVKLPNGARLLGVARTIALENGLRMGSTQYVASDERWTTSLDEAEEWLAEVAFESKDTLLAQAEPGAERWSTVVVLLGGADRSDTLPPAWRRYLRLAAGLRRIKLDIRTNPDAARARIIHDLRTRPPDGLLVWIQWVHNPESYTNPFLAARRDGWADVLGSGTVEVTFKEYVTELLMHLREHYPISSSRHDEPFPEHDEHQIESWSVWSESILSLEGLHFSLTERARRMLPRNPYPDPERMVKFVKSLAAVASAYHAKGGAMGQRLADYAIEQHAIEIALHDSSLSAPSFYFEGIKHTAVAHVKVDDVKSPNRCGRIYFAIDDRGHRFIVDHIGIHNYG